MLKYSDFLLQLVPTGIRLSCRLGCSQHLLPQRTESRQSALEHSLVISFPFVFCANIQDSSFHFYTYRHTPLSKFNSTAITTFSCVPGGFRPTWTIAKGSVQNHTPFRKLVPYFYLKQRDFLVEKLKTPSYVWFCSGQAMCLLWDRNWIFKYYFIRIYAKNI